MNPKKPSPVGDKCSSKTSTRNVEVAQLKDSDAAEDDPPPLMAQSSDLFDRVAKLTPQNKVLLIQQLIPQLKPAQIQSIVNFAQQILAEPHSTASTQRETGLVLKKDYTYQEQGLSEPTQYYVYLRRRKPKLDRYIGTLFYISQGCALSYTSDTAGRILFQPPHTVFQLTDSKNPSITQIVRLVSLEPPPADYTFNKQQHDCPPIYLRVEYLDPSTFHSIAEHSFPFPSCMHEGGQLDRYRWDVAAIHSWPLVEVQSTTSQMVESLADTLLTQPTIKPVISNDSPAPKIPQVFELPLNKLSTFYLKQQTDLDQVLERMRLWVSWSEKVSPQSKWAIVQNGSTYTLMNATFKRSILTVNSDDAAITLNGSLPVIVKWFYDLSLAVSQSQNQHRYPFDQLKIARSLFIEMSLSQKEPLPLLQKLFDIEFSRTSNKFG